MLFLQRDGFSRAVVPQSLQSHVLSLLHDGHWGIVRMKQMARRYVWWPTLNVDIEQLVKSCNACRSVANEPKSEFVSWPITKSPWDRIHLDYAGPFLGKMWFVCIDAHSKYPYVAMQNVGSTTSKQTIDMLQQIFAIEGIPNTCVTDNGPQFVSREFEEFCERRGITHITSPAFHPASNGEAERFVQTFKQGMKKTSGEGRLIDNLPLVLSSYRTSPHSALNGKTPAEVLHGRQPKTALSWFSPDQRTTDSTTTNDHAQSSHFQVGSLVYARNYASGPKWLEGKIICKIGRVLFNVRTDRGVWKRHVNQLQVRLTNVPQDENHSRQDFETQQCERPTSAPVSSDPPPRRYPRRQRRPPDFYVAS